MKRARPRNVPTGAGIAAGRKAAVAAVAIKPYKNTNGNNKARGFAPRFYFDLY
jgi:hypothetical protein